MRKLKTVSKRGRKKLPVNQRKEQLCIYVPLEAIIAAGGKDIASHIAIQAVMNCQKIVEKNV